MNDLVETAEKIIAEGSAPKTVVVDDEKKPVIPMEQQLTAKHNCKHCHGRGYVGTDVKTKQKVPCRCLRPANKTTAVQGKKVDSSTGW